LSYTRAVGIEAVSGVRRAVRLALYSTCSMLSKWRMTVPHVALALICVAVLLAVAPPGARAAGPSVLCSLKPGTTALPADALRGLAHHLRQYPDLTLATPAQRRAAALLLARLRTATARWVDLRRAGASGFDTRLAARRGGARVVGYLHAEHRRYSHDARVLDPHRPESLIYATEPHRAPTLIGAMFSVPRGVLGPTPSGPIARWHSHVVCVTGDKRGLAPRADGTCPKGAVRTQGSEMLHVWFTRDLRSALAIHAPVPELCRDGLLSKAACSARTQGREM